MNTTNTNEPIERKEKQKGTLFVADLEMRDYFAAKAMQGFCTTLKQNSGEPFWNVIAEDSYKLADAMLKARND